jgi:hypothetical protein
MYLGIYPFLGYQIYWYMVVIIVSIDSCFCGVGCYVFILILDLSLAKNLSVLFFLLKTPALCSSFLIVLVFYFCSDIDYFLLLILRLVSSYSSSSLRGSNRLEIFLCFLIWALIAIKFLLILVLLYPIGFGTLCLHLFQEVSGAEGMTQVIEHLLSNCEVLSSNHSTTPCQKKVS